MSIDEKRIMRAYMSRKIRTMPFLFIMFLSLLPLSLDTVQWLRGHMLWHTTSAVITQVEPTLEYEYTDEKNGVIYSAASTKPALFIAIPFFFSSEGDQLSMAYNVDKPTEHVLFSKLECGMFTWAAVFVFCFVMYFWLEWHIKKKSKIKIAG